MNRKTLLAYRPTWSLMWVGVVAAMLLGCGAKPVGSDVEATLVTSTTLPAVQRMIAEEVQALLGRESGLYRGANGGVVQLRRMDSPSGRVHVLQMTAYASAATLKLTGEMACHKPGLKSNTEYDCSADLVLGGPYTGRMQGGWSVGPQGGECGYDLYTTEGDFIAEVDMSF